MTEKCVMMVERELKIVPSLIKTTPVLFSYNAVKSLFLFFHVSFIQISFVRQQQTILSGF